jgi:PAS domain S-box-containing protein
MLRMPSSWPTRDGIIRPWNAAASTVFGYSAAEAVGQSLDLIVPEQFRVRHWDGFGKGYGDRSHPVCHGAACRAGYQERPGADLGGIQRHAACDSADEIAGVAAIMRDATQRWTEQRQIRQCLAELEAQVGATGAD